MVRLPHASPVLKSIPLIPNPNNGSLGTTGATTGETAAVAFVAVFLSVDDPVDVAGGCLIPMPPMPPTPNIPPIGSPMPTPMPPIMGII